ncbi:MAG: flavodoxin family protein, partial [Selenomonas sp.]|nr:flavodoxin family protein [Selenomonas sp.]
TAKLLDKVQEGAQAAGADTKIIHLYDFQYQGCKSCFACKLKNSKTDGLCAIRDDLRPVLQEVLAADSIVIGSPVYFAMPTGQVRSFFERLAFPNFSYDLDEKGMPRKIRERKIPTAFIYTMGCPPEYAKQLNYDTLLGITGDFLGNIFGENEQLLVYDTYQFTDYTKYAAGSADVSHKEKVKETEFPRSLAAAYELGQRLAQKAISDI